jgi:folylpolyglutamate synthase/dihydropteroate synthase
VPVNSPRTLAPAQLAAACRAAHPSAEVFATNSAAEALALAAPEPFLVVTGSLYLVGSVLELLQPGPATDEGRLNDYGPAAR